MPSPSRSARRNGHKRLARSLKASEAPYSALVCRWLAAWRAEAQRRARLLGAPAVWALLRGPRVVALLRQLDPSGELAQDLARLCAEAVAAVSDPRMARGCRPASVPARRKS